MAIRRTGNHIGTRGYPSYIRAIYCNGGKKIEQQIEITSPKEQKQREFAQLSRLMAYAEDGTCLNLTSKVKNGKLEWNAPKGEWKLIALFVGKTLQK